MKNPIIQYEPKKQKKVGIFSHLPTSHKILGILALTVITVPFLFIGVVDAFGSLILSGAENSYNSNVTNVKTALTACEASYQSLLNIKKEAGLELKGTGSACKSF